MKWAYEKQTRLRLAGQKIHKLGILDSSTSLDKFKFIGLSFQDVGEGPVEMGPCQGGRGVLFYAIVGEWEQKTNNIIK